MGTDRERTPFNSGLAPMQSSLRMHSLVTFNSILDFPTAAAHWLFTICRLLRLLHSSSCSSACSSTERTTKDTNYKQRNYYARCRGIQFDVIAPVCVLHGSGLLIWKREQSRVGWRQPLYYYIILYYIIISGGGVSVQCFCICIREYIIVSSTHLPCRTCTVTCADLAFDGLQE